MDKHTPEQEVQYLREAIGRPVPELWLEKLRELPYGRQSACVKLLKTKKFRSVFRKSLRNQLENWLNGNGYETPFSWKQWNCLMRSHYYKRPDAIETGYEDYPTMADYVAANRGML
jgi:hypothetical protein